MNIFLLCGIVQFAWRRNMGILFDEQPCSSDSCAGEAHRRYTRAINFKNKWRGHLWQERFASFPMDEKHLLTAARYVELNPVRAHITTDPLSYHWSRARSHVLGEDDALVSVKPLLEFIPDWQAFLMEGIEEKENRRLRMHERSGRQLGNESFINKVENMANRVLHKQKPGIKKGTREK